MQQNPIDLMAFQRNLPLSQRVASICFASAGQMGTGVLDVAIPGIPFIAHGISINANHVSIRSP